MQRLNVKSYLEFVVSSLDPSKELVHQLEVGLAVSLEQLVEPLGQERREVLGDQLLLQRVDQLPLRALEKQCILRFECKSKYAFKDLKAPKLTLPSCSLFVEAVGTLK